MTNKIDRSGAREVIERLRTAITTNVEYETGDLVGLRSFGAKMTVIGTDGDVVEVAYFDTNNVLRKEVLPADALKLLGQYDD